MRIETSLFDMAQRKARYGHRPWVHWRDRNGEPHAERATHKAVKQAMLDTGTQGKFTLFAGDGCPMLIRWPVAINVLSNAKAGLLT